MLRTRPTRVDRFEDRTSGLRDGTERGSSAMFVTFAVEPGVCRHL